MAERNHQVNTRAALDKEFEDQQLPGLNKTGTNIEVESQVGPVGESEKTVVPQVKETQPRYSVFTSRQKGTIVAMASIAGMFSPLTANIYFPALNSVAETLHVSTEKVNLTITMYMIFQGLAPTFWGSLTDRVGRRPVYLSTFLVLIVSSVGLAVADTYWLVMVLRMAQAAGSASVIAIGAGTIGDISMPFERAGYMGYFGTGAYAGPAIGPFLGGILNEYLGWRAIFWFLVIFAGVYTLILLIFLPETMRKKVGNGSHQSKKKWQLPLAYSFGFLKFPPPEGLPPKKHTEYLNPVNSLAIIAEKDIFLVLLFNAVIYTAYYAVTSSTTELFTSIYHLNSLQVGLCFIANGVGAMIGSILRGKLMNADYRAERAKWEAQRQPALAEEHHGAEAAAPRGNNSKPSYDDNDLSTFPIERARMRSLPYTFLALIGALIAYGWFLQYGIHLAAPVICQFLIGAASTTVFGITSTMMVDMYPQNPASATAVINLMRCLMGAGGVALIDRILTSLHGPGWTFTMIALLCLAMAPIPMLEWRYGMKWRLQRAARLEKAQKA